MTEVVTNTAAYLQSLLYAPRQQGFGVPNPDSPQNTFEIALAASQQQAEADASQVAPASDDRSSLGQGDDSPANRSFANQLPTPQPKAPEPSLATTGPAKARVDISLVEISHAAATALRETPAPQAPVQTEPKPLSFGNLAGGAAGPLQQPAPAPVNVPTGILGPAAVIHESEILTANVFGAAFAPTQVAQTSVNPAPTQTQKNFIFAQRKLFNEQVAVDQVAGKFVSEDAKAKTFAAEATVGKFAPQPTAAAAATVGAQFAANADSAQRLFDKVVVSSNTADSAGNDTRLYDTVTQTDTQNQNNSGNSGPGDQSLDSRQSLYQRAQAVAQALGEKSANPAVKKLMATLEAYAAVTKVGESRSGRSTVRVIA